MKSAIKSLLFIAIFLSCKDRVIVNETDVRIPKKDSVPNGSRADSNALVDKTLAIAKASVSGEIAEIYDYVSIVLDSSSSKTVKNGAFKALHNLYPNAFTNIRDVKKSADKVAAALVRQAQIKAIKEKISEINEAEAAKK